MAVPLASLANGYYTCAIHDVSYKTAAYHEAERLRIEREKAAFNAINIVPGPRS